MRTRLHLAALTVIVLLLAFKYAYAYSDVWLYGNYWCRDYRFKAYIDVYVYGGSIIMLYDPDTGDEIDHIVLEDGDEVYISIPWVDQVEMWVDPYTQDIEIYYALADVVKIYREGRLYAQYENVVIEAYLAYEKSASGLSAVGFVEMVKDDDDCRIELEVNGTEVNVERSVKVFTMTSFYVSAAPDDEKILTAEAGYVEVDGKTVPEATIASTLLAGLTASALIYIARRLRS